MKDLYELTEDEMISAIIEEHEKEDKSAIETENALAEFRAENEADYEEFANNMPCDNSGYCSPSCMRCK